MKCFSFFLQLKRVLIKSLSTYSLNYEIDYYFHQEILQKSSYILPTKTTFKFSILDSPQSFIARSVSHILQFQYSSRINESNYVSCLCTKLLLCLFGGKLKPEIFWAEFSCSCGRHCDMCEISNRAGPGSAPLACAIFTDENCNHGQKVAFLV